MNHEVDYSKHCETPVKNSTQPFANNRSMDIVIFGCTCGEEGCTWQVEVTRKTQFQN